jgi:hypothetical protein
MPKEFYTEKDIEDMFKRGISSLDVNDNVVLTGLAYEKAGRLGMRLVRQSPDNPPAAPVRPYISRNQEKHPSPSATTTGQACACASSPQAAEDLSNQERIRSAVIARLGAQVDAKLLDVIIKRVMQSTGVK